MFEKLNSRLRDDKKIEQNYLDASAFAIVYLLAKHASGTVFNM